MVDVQTYKVRAKLWEFN